MAIFRTSNGRGWGVKAMQRIPKGSFVMQYVGEVKYVKCEKPLINKKKQSSILIYALHAY